MNDEQREARKQKAILTFMKEKTGVKVRKRQVPGWKGSASGRRTRSKLWRAGARRTKSAAR